MPWTLVGRLIFGVVTFWFVRRRRQGRPAIDAGAVRRRLEAARSPAAILTRGITTVVLGSFAAVLATAGTSSLLLTPRWLGGVFLAIALVFGIAAVQELLILRREVRQRRQRIHAAAVAREIDVPVPPPAR